MSIIQEELNDLFDKADKADELTEDVYHYTKSESLMPILTSRKLFMSDYKDILSEFEHPLQCLKKLIPEINLPTPIHCEAGRLTKFWETLDWYLRDKIRCFRLSFCLKRDDSNMWNTFGENGKGYAIRISKDYFKLSASPLTLNPDSKTSPTLVRTRIAYEDGKEKGYLTKLANLINKHLDNLSPKNQKDILAELYPSIISWIPKFLTAETNLHNEHEYRCYTFYDHLSAPPNIIKLNNTEGIYTGEIPFAHIVEILVGPNTNFNEREEEIKEALSKDASNRESNHIKITKSELTLAN